MRASARTRRSRGGAKRRAPAATGWPPGCGSGALEPLTGVANFLCVEVGDGAAFAARLERQGVIVRPLGPFGDPASVRISVGSPEELDRLFSAIDAG